MGMSSGTRVGPYEILAPLGAGGMGEVYRARDARLKRDVAIKILPPEFANDNERLARFAREAQALAALNHPNIAGIYGVEETAEGRALVMELVDGLTLADRLEKGPIAVDEAIGIARQIADALEAAHEKAIIHRDLKPANIAITADGDVKVLDFGLAKALEPEAGSDPSLSPTLTLRATQAGVILGTAAYMSPEQARGRTADKRTDVWAFGCVLYEMLTGKRAFAGDDVTDTIAAVVRAEPEWTALPAGTPPQIELLIRRCLVKDRKHRVSDIGVARFLLNEAGAAPVPPIAPGVMTPARSRIRRMLPLAAAALAGIALAAIAFWGAARLRPAAVPQPMRFAVSLLSQPVSFAGIDRDIAISPDGRFIVYRSVRAGQAFLALRAINRLDAQVLTSTVNPRQPFFSPDGRWIGFFSGTELKKVSIDGGSAITLCSIAGVPRVATWGDDDVITFATNDNEVGLQKVSAGGGTPSTITSRDTAKGELDHINPFALPGGRGVLFTIVTKGYQLEGMQIAVLDQRSNHVKVILQSGTDAKYLPTGHLVYGVGGGLRAAQFDLERLEVTTVPVHPMRFGPCSGSIGKDARKPSVRRRAAITCPACRLMALVSPWKCAIRKTISGSGILRLAT
jgi:serine/threonine-protein kinase